MADLGRWLIGAALPLWWGKGADHDLGGFHDLIGPSGRPVRAPRRARVIARQTWVYAKASVRDSSGSWRDAARHGLDFMIGRQTRPDGLLISVLAADGSPAGGEVKLYDQAFALLALAAATEAGLEPDRQTQRALRILDELELNWRAPAGGFFEREAQAYQSNPLMHLFEAALAWRALGVDRRWTALADNLGELTLERFIDPAGGFVREIYDADWRPGLGEGAREVWPGHQFEWAWLLACWAEIGGRSEASVAARRLFEIARDHGIDSERDVAVDALDDNMTVISARARLWPQTERIKSAAIFGEAREVERATAGLAKYLTTPVQGLWRDKMTPSGAFVDEPAPASSFYHIACAIWEAQARGFAI